MKDLKVCENIYSCGTDKVSNSDLIGAITDIDTARIINDEDFYNKVATCHTPAELMQKLNLSKETATVLMSAIELGKRLATDEAIRNIPTINRPADVYNLLKYLRYETQEKFILLCLSGTCKLLVPPIVLSSGTATCASISQQDVFKNALIHNAQKIIISHNHPSGNPTPSREDKNITKCIREAGDLMGIKLVDHVVIGAGEYYSFSDSGIL